MDTVTGWFGGFVSLSFFHSFSLLYLFYYFGRGGQGQQPDDLYRMPRTQRTEQTTGQNLHAQIRMHGTFMQGTWPAWNDKMLLGTGVWQFECLLYDLHVCYVFIRERGGEGNYFAYVCYFPTLPPFPPSVPFSFPFCKVESEKLGK